MKLPTLTRTQALLLGKGLVAAVAVGLAVSGHLPPSAEHIVELLLGSLGLGSLAQIVAEGKAAS